MMSWLSSTASHSPAHPHTCQAESSWSGLDKTLGHGVGPDPTPDNMHPPQSGAKVDKTPVMRKLRVTEVHPTAILATTRDVAREHKWRFGYKMRPFAVCDAGHLSGMRVPNSHAQQVMRRKSRILKGVWKPLVMASEGLSKNVGRSPKGPSSFREGLPGAL